MKVQLFVVAVLEETKQVLGSQRLHIKFKK